MEGIFMKKWATGPYDTEQEDGSDLSVQTPEGVAQGAPVADVVAQLPRDGAGSPSAAGASAPAVDTPVPVEELPAQDQLDSPAVVDNSVEDWADKWNKIKAYLGGRWDKILEYVQAHPKRAAGLAAALGVPALGATMTGGLSGGLGFGAGALGGGYAGKKLVDSFADTDTFKNLTPQQQMLVRLAGLLGGGALGGGLGYAGAKSLLGNSEKQAAAIDQAYRRILEQ